MEKVSIIIPALVTTQQGLQWLSECLHTCVGQSDDILVWDDGSTKDVGSLCVDYPSVRFLNVGGTHNGKGFARNQLVLNSKHDLIYPVDADDMLVSSAIQTLVSEWDGIPLYSPIIRLHADGVMQTDMLAIFDCDAIVKNCITSVNVLHHVQQWHQIGGWSDAINLYEDWEYNARLMWRFCGHRVNRPLVYYRQHPQQSTRLASQDDNRNALKLVQYMIEDCIGRNMMGCCGKRRSGTSMVGRMTSHAVTPAAHTSNSPSVSFKDNVQRDDPGPGKVWARYVGGNGMGPHERRGMGSRKRYKVQYGGVYVVTAADAISPAALNGGAPNCGFVILQQERAKPVLPPAPPPSITPVSKVIKEDAVERKPVVSTPKTVIGDDNSVDDLVARLKGRDISIRELVGELKNRTFSGDDLQLMLAAEEAGGSRMGAVKLIQRAMR